jgi:hypothetical protein
MEIIIDVAKSRDGRLTGTAGLVESQNDLPFTGTMELLACVEELCRRGSAADSVGSGPGRSGDGHADA